MAFFILPLLSARDLDIGPEGFSPMDDISRASTHNNTLHVLQRTALGPAPPKTGPVHTATHYTFYREQPHPKAGPVCDDTDGKLFYPLICLFPNMCTHSYDNKHTFGRRNASKMIILY
jgi:hypothetical protein